MMIVFSWPRLPFTDDVLFFVQRIQSRSLLLGTALLAMYMLLIIIAADDSFKFAKKRQKNIFFSRLYAIVFFNDFLYLFHL